MDTSETYIKMSGKAEEIQELWQPSVGDWFLHDWHGTTGFGNLEDTIWADKKHWEQIECLTHKPDINDYIEISREDGSHGVYTSSSLLKDRHIWLPRQDQLQEIVGGFGAGFIDWRHWRNTVYPHMQNPFNKNWRFTSWEQLWLAFVMKERYNKIWSNGEWAKQIK